MEGAEAAADAAYPQLASSSSGLASERLDVREAGAQLSLELGQAGEVQALACAADLLDDLGWIGGVGEAARTTGEPAREVIGLLLVRTVGPREPAAWRLASQVMSDMRGLVRDQLDSGLAFRVVCAGREVDVGADRERSRPELGGGGGRGGVGVDADPFESNAQLDLEARA